MLQSSGYGACGVIRLGVNTYRQEQLSERSKMSAVFEYASDHGRAISSLNGRELLDTILL